jgi:hypothetical protein
MPESARHLLFEMPLMAPHKRPSKPTAFVPLDSHDRLLEAILRYRYLTNEQLTRLFYQPGMASTVRGRTGALEQAGHLFSVPLPASQQRGGSGPKVYLLDSPGLARLRQLGHPVPKRFHKQELVRLADNPAWLRSRLAENDVLAAVERLCRQYPEVVSLQPPPERFAAPGAMLHQWNLASHPARVTVAAGSGAERRMATTTVTPDGWVHLAVTANAAYRQRTGHDGYTQAIAFEVDGNTEFQKQWRRKIRALVAWTETAYGTDFGTQSLVIATLVVAGRKLTPELAHRRCRQLVHWTEAELTHLQELGRTRLNRDQLRQLFMFTSADPTQEAPADLFFAPRWYEPFGQQPIPLLEDVAGRRA